MTLMLGLLVRPMAQRKNSAAKKYFGDPQPRVYVRGTNRVENISSLLKTLKGYC